MSCYAIPPNFTSRQDALAFQLIPVHLLISSRKERACRIIFPVHAAAQTGPQKVLGLTPLIECVGSGRYPLFEPRNLLRFNAFTQDEELIATHPGDKVVAAIARLPEQIRKPYQRVVAGFMPVPVIDLLEVIQIQHHRKELMIFSAQFQLPLKMLVQAAPVIQTGQVIG